jgi:capsular exopolysaccharide synthesis family protein
MISGLDDSIVTISHSGSAVAEQYRILCARIDRLSRERGYKTIALTSSVKGEGKTLTSVNLAFSMAKDLGKHVLLVEADFRNTSLTRLIDKPKSKGFLDVISNGTGIESVKQSYLNDRLGIVTAGKVTPEALKLFASKRTEEIIQGARKDYDYIFFDLPPILATADANIITEWVDGVIMVVRAGETPRDIVKKALAGSTKVIGVVLNDVKVFSSYYYYYNTK